MSTRKLSYRARPLLVVGAVIASILVWSCFARSRSVHVNDVIGEMNNDLYTIRFSVVNPRDHAVAVTLEPSIMTGGRGSRTLSKTSIDIEMKPNQERKMEVSLDRPQYPIQKLPTVTVFRPQVLVVRVDPLN